MAHHKWDGEAPSVECNDTNSTHIFHMDSDEAFTATPLIANASTADNNSATADPTFMQNQISIQRSPSTAISQASALSRKLSVNSNGSHEAVTGPSISGVLLDNGNEKAGRGRGRGSSTSSLIEATSNCNLAKSSSVSTHSSKKSVASAKSVHSVHAVGSFPLGSLRLHSPSPTQGGDEKRQFLKSGDVLVVRDVPSGALIGYDTRGLSIKDEKFDGIKDIPPGAHFVWGGSTVSSLRNGFWFMTAKKATNDLGEIHVKRWDKHEEVLGEEVSAAEIRIQKEGIAEIFDQLHNYTIMIPNPAPTRASGIVTSSMAARDPNIWHHLTGSMKGSMLIKITGKEWNQWSVSSTDDYKPDDQFPIHPDDKVSPKDEVLNFIFPKTTKYFADTSTGRDRTEQALDTSAHVSSIIQNRCSFEDSDEIVGELQFCYITGMVLGNLACMEHWAHMIKVLFKAYHLALDSPVFFKKVIEALHSQFMYDHTGMDSSILDHDENLPTDLKMILTIFKSRLNELLMVQGSDITPDQSAVGQAFEEFESWLWGWDWDLRGNYVRSGQIQLEDGEFVDAEIKDFEAEDERGEYAPMVVDIDEEGRERGLIHW